MMIFSTVFFQFPKIVTRIIKDPIEATNPHKLWLHLKTNSTPQKKHNVNYRRWYLTGPKDLESMLQSELSPSTQQCPSGTFTTSYV